MTPRIRDCRRCVNERGNTERRREWAYQDRSDLPALRTKQSSVLVREADSSFTLLQGADGAGRRYRAFQAVRPSKPNLLRRGMMESSTAP